MTDTFDPYHKWLGIPPKDQPPNHYRLLGLELFESIPEVIESAADRQMAHLQMQRTGAHVNESQKLLNEVAAARVRLLDADRKGAYDSQLQSALQEKKRPTPVKEPEMPSKGVDESVMEISAGESFRPAVRLEAKRQGTRSLVVTTAMFLFLLAAGFGVLFWLVGRNSSETEFAEQPESIPDSPHENPASFGNLHDEQRFPSLDQNVPGTSAGRPQQNVAVEPQGRVSKQPVTPAELSPRPPDATPRNKKRPVPGKVNSQAGNQPTKSTSDPVRPSAPPESPTLPQATEKRPIPGEEEQAAARHRIEEKFGSEIVNDRSSGKQSHLIQGLFEAVDEITDDPPLEFTMLSLIRDVASGGGDWDNAGRAISELGARFEIDELAQRATSLSRALKVAKDPVTRAGLLDFALPLVDELVGEDRVKLADDLLLSMLNVALRLPDGKETVSAISERRRLVTLLEKELQKVTRAQSVLESNPYDAGANLTVGRYRVFVKQNWGQGFEYLAKGSDENLAEVARGELAEPEEDTKRVRLGDLWWKNAEMARGQEKIVCLMRAEHWYEQALRELTDLERKKRIEKRIADVKSASASAVLSKSAGARAKLLPGLVAEYYQGVNFQKPLVMRVDSMVGLQRYRDRSQGLPQRNISVRWTGYLVVPSDGQYQFRVRTDDGHRMWIDGEIVADRWSASAGNRSFVTKQLKAGPHAFRFEFMQYSGPMRLQLSWGSEGSSDIQPVSADAFAHLDNVGKKGARK